MSTAADATRDALYAAILAHPDEDTPRLVFADYLDELGDHHRAEFIRLPRNVLPFRAMWSRAGVPTRPSIHRTRAASRCCGSNRRGVRDRAEAAGVLPRRNPSA